MATTSDFLNTVVASPEPEESEDSITHVGSYIEPDVSIAALSLATTPADVGAWRVRAFGKAKLTAHGTAEL